MSVELPSTIRGNNCRQAQVEYTIERGGSYRLWRRVGVFGVFATFNSLVHSNLGKWSQQGRAGDNWGPELRPKKNGVP